MGFILTTAIRAGTLFITVGCIRLDAAVASEFKAEVESAWKTGLTRVEIDLGAVEFIDSSGVGALLGVVRKLPTGKGLTHLSHVRPSVWAVLDVLRLRSLFEPPPRASSLTGCSFSQQESLARVYPR